MRHLRRYLRGSATHDFLMVVVVPAIAAAVSYVLAMIAGWLP